MMGGDARRLDWRGGGAAGGALLAALVLLAVVFLVVLSNQARDDALVGVFFVQAEDGIRGGRVTGVQTCALPIYETTDLRPSTAAANAETFSISPEYFRAAGTTLLAGRDFTWKDEKNAPLVAVINGEFARRIFGSVTNAMGRYYKMPDGKRIQVVGIVEDGKYSLNLNDPLPPAMFVPILQSP